MVYNRNGRNYRKASFGWYGTRGYCGDYRKTAFAWYATRGLDDCDTYDGVFFDEMDQMTTSLTYALLWRAATQKPRLANNQARLQRLQMK